MLTRACMLVLFAVVFTGEAVASELIGREADRVGLQVNGAGQAHVAQAQSAGTQAMAR